MHNKLLQIIALVIFSSVSNAAIWLQQDKALILVADNKYRVSSVYDVSFKHSLCMLDKPNSQSMKNRLVDSASLKQQGNLLYVKKFSQSFKETFTRYRRLVPPIRKGALIFLYTKQSPSRVAGWGV